ncbi:MAG: CDP-diacylglycerol O-phosphatidyltransferase [Deltaproteobacteria bacterium]|nr:MAG: CDP-diacylglycerol O-phosphatidyltransferase [Deltaproteobacteria bacterium]
MPSNGAPTVPTPRHALAWSVHLFTASGAVLGVFALWEIGRGGFARAAIYMLAALAIDAVDGTLARRVDVAERLPRIDGRTLDDVVDYLNYGIVPVVFLLQLGAFAHWSVVVLPVLAASYGFAQVDVKTEDDFFLGWPSYWNVVALYVWLLDLSPAAASAWVALFSALTFVPLKYIYPSKMRRWRAVTSAGGMLWMIAMALIAQLPPGAARDRATEISLFYPAYYVALSAWLGEWWAPGRRA